MRPLRTTDERIPAQRKLTGPHGFVGPGEDVFAAAMRDAGIEFSYEPYLYELVVTFEDDGSGVVRRRTRKGFSPDFLIHANETWPEFHVEIASGRRVGKKVTRIRDTRAAYGIHTILLRVGTKQWDRITARPDELVQLLRRAGHRARGLTVAS